MKKTAWIAAALLAAAWAPVSAAEAAPASSADTLTAISGELDTAASVGVIGGQAAGFIPKLDLGDGMSYHPVDLRSLDPTLPETAVWGQLRIDKDGILQTADVIDLAGENPDLDAVTEGMFGPGSTVTAEGVQKIALFNTILGRAGAMLNEAILNGIADVRKQSGEPLPYSILHTELRSVEALHLMEGTGGGLVYTTGARVLVYADGWVLPGYVRAYLWKVGTSYRTILLWANDSQKDAAQAAGDRLVRRLVTER